MGGGCCFRRKIERPNFFFILFFLLQYCEGHLSRCPSVQTSPNYCLKVKCKHIIFLKRGPEECNPRFPEKHGTKITGKGLFSWEMWSQMWRPRGQLSLGAVLLFFSPSFTWRLTGTPRLDFIWIAPVIKLGTGKTGSWSGNLLPTETQENELVSERCLNTHNDPLRFAHPSVSFGTSTNLREICSEREVKSRLPGQQPASLVQTSNFQ